MGVTFVAKYETLYIILSSVIFLTGHGNLRDFEIILILRYNCRIVVIFSESCTLQTVFKGSLMVVSYLCSKSAVIYSCTSHLIDRVERTCCFLWEIVSFIRKVFFPCVVYWRNGHCKVGYDMVIFRNPTVLQPACLQSETLYTRAYCLSL